MNSPQSTCIPVCSLKTSKETKTKKQPNPKNRTATARATTTTTTTTTRITKGFNGGSVSLWNKFCLRITQSGFQKDSSPPKEWNKNNNKEAQQGTKMFDLASHSSVRRVWGNLSDGSLNPFTKPLPLTPCSVDPGFPIRYTAGTFSLIQIQADSALAGSCTLLTFKAGIPWENSQEILLELLAGFQGLGFPSPGKWGERKGGRERETEGLYWVTVFHLKLVQKKSRNVVGWLDTFLTSYLLSSYYDSSDFGWVF